MRGRIGNLDIGAVAQPVGAVDHHRVAGLDARQDLDLVAVLHAGRDGALASPSCRAVTTKTKVPSAPRWIAGDRHHGLVVQRVDQQADIDELVGEQLAVLIVEHGAQLDRAGGGVDLLSTVDSVPVASLVVWLRS